MPVKSFLSPPWDSREAKGYILYFVPSTAEELLYSDCRSLVDTGAWTMWLTM